MAENEAKIVLSGDNTPLVNSVKQADDKIANHVKNMEKNLSKVEGDFQAIGEASTKTAKDVAAATTQLEASSKRASGVATELAKKMRQLQVIEATGVERRSVAQTVEQEKRATELLRQEERRRTITHQFEEKARLAATREAKREAAKTETRFNQRALREFKKMKREELDLIKRVNAEAAKAIKSPAQAQIAFSAMMAAQQRLPTPQLLASMGTTIPASSINFLAPGAGPTGTQLWNQQQQLNALAPGRLNVALATQALFAGGAGGGAGGRGRGNGLWRGGGWQRILGGGPGGFAAGLLGGIGVGVGGYAVARGIRGTVEATETATAYERQRVAAEQLAGSQTQLNDLMDAYGEASGGAIDKTTTLANVTRLLATGFADSVPEVERFVAATRGASIALGKPQDYVIQETQLAISNISVKRLDQIGLGITEVQERIAQLRKENTGWTREMAFQEAVLGLMEEKYGELTKSVAGQKTGVEQLRAAWSDLGLAWGQLAGGPINRFSEALAKVLKYFEEIAVAQEKVRQGTFEGLTEESTLGERRGFEIAQSKQMVARENARFWDQIGATWLRRQITGQTQAQINAQRVLANPSAFGWPIAGSRGDAGPTLGPPTGPLSFRERFSEDEQAIIISANAQMLQLERDYSRARLDAIRQYEEQRINLVKDYTKQLAREEEDFQRSRARSQRDYERSVRDVIEDARRREADLRDNYHEQVADLQEDLDERLADIREDGEERISDIQEKYIKDRERAERDHREKLLTAAGQLNAIAVVEEQRRYARENREREEAHEEALEKERENQDKQIEEAQRAHAKRLADATEAYERNVEESRRAEEKRLEDMREARAIQLADEDEDRAIRKARAEQDHQDQLAEMKRQHEITMIRLEAEAEANRQILEDQLEAELAAVGHFVDGYLEKQKEKDQAIMDWFDEIIAKIERMNEAERTLQESRTIYYPGSEPGRGMGAYADGGYVPVTGPAMLHAGEFVLSRDMLAAGWSPTSNSLSYNSRNISVEAGAVQVFASPNQSAAEIAQIVNEQMMANFRELAGGNV